MQEPSLDMLDIHTVELYVSRGYPWAEWDLLRLGISMPIREVE